jgi:hypothetical protein
VGATVYRVAVERDWLPIVIASVAAGATFLAVVVALLGPVLQRRLRRPILTPGVERDWREGMFYLTVTNASGRDTAIDVEVHVVEARPALDSQPPSAGASSTLQPKIGRPLEATESLEPSPAQSVPGGFTRRWDFVAHPGFGYNKKEGIEEFKTAPSLPLKTLPQPRELSKLWFGGFERDELAGYERSLETAARIRLAIAATNASAFEVVVLFGFYPSGLGLYDHSIDSWFYFDLESDAPRARKCPLPNESLIQRLRKSRRS